MRPLEATKALGGDGIRWQPMKTGVSEMVIGEPLIDLPVTIRVSPIGIFLHYLDFSFLSSLASFS